MSAGGEMDRRRFLASSAGAGGALVGAAPAALAQSQEPPTLEEGFILSAPPLVSNWRKQLGDVTQINFDKEAGELNHPAVQERHRIYSYLLMKLIHRFWNGNKNGPVGTYPQRTKQLEKGRTDRYGGDIHERSDRAHIPWDRYIGHNIACIAVDGLGHIIDFDFNHNPFFRNTVEHAESRLVRRLFSLTDVFDSWRTGRNINNKPHAALLSDVTLYTSLESCAQCSGIMSLAGVRQVIYMQNDFTTYKIGNIMFNLANRATVRDDDGHVITNSDATDKTIPGAPIPIPASRIGLERPFNKLNDANVEFIKKMQAASRFSHHQTASLSIESLPSLRFCAPTRPWTYSRKEATRSTRWCFNTRSIPFRSRVRSQPSRRNACLPTRNASTRPTNSLSTSTSRAIGGRRTSFDGLPFLCLLDKRMQRLDRGLPALHGDKQTDRMRRQHVLVGNNPVRPENLQRPERQFRRDAAETGETHRA
jgi:tRNA(Arg) A34 adenosine deaminase TadA